MNLRRDFYRRWVPLKLYRTGRPIGRYIAVIYGDAEYERLSIEGLTGGHSNALLLTTFTSVAVAGS